MSQQKTLLYWRIYFQQVCEPIVASQFLLFHSCFVILNSLVDSIEDFPPPSILVLIIQIYPYRLRDSEVLFQGLERIVREGHY